MKQVYIGVIGASECGRELADEAYALGMGIAENGWVLVCGGMGGVMEAVSRGVSAAGGTALGILPGHDRAEGNAYLTYSIVTGLGHARNLTVVESSTALVAVGGSYGTLSEISFANILGKPVIGLKSWRCAAPGEPGHPKDTDDVVAPGDQGDFAHSGNQGQPGEPGRSLFREQVESAREAILALKRFLKTG
jgi:uncharacterized protein (TIGR00725 family)